MKILNWVYRKFHRQNELSSALVRDELCGDQTMVLKVGSDHTQSFLRQGALIDVLGGWNDCILTIGTLGFDDQPLSSFHFNYNEIENDHDDEHEKQDCSDGDCEDTLGDTAGEKYPLVMKAIRDSFKEEVLGLNGKNIVAQVLDYEKLEKNNIRERTTLADLFYADYDHGVKGKIDMSPSKEHPKSKRNGDVGTKQSTDKKKCLPRLPFAKKLIPLAGEDSSRPIKKINKLMTKMLKRKIHPELEGNDPKSEGNMINQNACRPGANEKLSLLQTQDIVL